MLNIHRLQNRIIHFILSFLILFSALGMSVETHAVECGNTYYEELTYAEAVASGREDWIAYVLGVGDPGRSLPSALNPQEWRRVLESQWPIIAGEVNAGLSMREMITRASYTDEAERPPPPSQLPKIPLMTPNTPIPLNFPQELRKCFINISIPNVFECVDRANQFCEEHKHLYPDQDCYLFYYFVFPQQWYSFLPASKAGHALPVVKKIKPNGDFEYCMFDPEQQLNDPDARPTPIYCWTVTPNSGGPSAAPPGLEGRFHGPHPNTPECDREFRRTIWPRLPGILVPDQGPAVPNSQNPNQWNEYSWRFFFKKFRDFRRPDRMLPEIPEKQYYWWECTRNFHDLESICNYFRERGLTCPGLPTCESLKDNECVSGEAQVCMNGTVITVMSCCIYPDNNLNLANPARGFLCNLPIPESPATDPAPVPAPRQDPGGGGGGFWK